MRSLAPTELGLLLVLLPLVLLPLAVVVWGLADAAGRPASAWRAAGENKTLWVALQAAGLVVFLAGVVLSVVYLAALRPRVRAAQQ